MLKRISRSISIIHMSILHQ